jgi:hypothetical protein
MVSTRGPEVVKGYMVHINKFRDFVNAIGDSDIMHQNSGFPEASIS